MKIKYTQKELLAYFIEAVGSLFRGFCRIIWTVFLLFANITIAVAMYVAGLIRKAPVLAVCLTFAVMFVASVVSYAEMKTRLTTAEWQRDSLTMKLDSVLTMNNTKKSYYRFEKYK